MTDQALEIRYARLLQLTKSLSLAITMYAEHQNKTREVVPHMFWPAYCSVVEFLQQLEEQDHWREGNPPHKHNVLVRYHAPRSGALPKTIVAFMGSEGKWCAMDHDSRVTHLTNDTVTGWREIPE